MTEHREWTGGTVSFTQMKDGTPEDTKLVFANEVVHAEGTADRVLAELKKLKDTFSCYQVDRLEHSLQSATRAHRDGADVDMVVSALLHDIGDLLAPHNHAEYAATILKPFVREECWWVVNHHDTFQKFYYAHHIGGNKDERDKFRDNPYFDACAHFCEVYDQSSFDPAYDSENLEFFAPMVREIFARKAFDPNILKRHL
ncbi:HD domain-containing protein [Aestuariispira ectoiniformans]|uniref:HD domain-containing protein n=1 Tax=Aestuariispira ectoiniformans TaxID=2775080 RepID=UPI00223BC7DB|nr:HD domain-containing protein [Aestuariispira ectoiniformans]